MAVPVKDATNNYETTRPCYPLPPHGQEPLDVISGIGLTFITAKSCSITIRNARVKYLHFGFIPYTILSPLPVVPKPLPKVTLIPPRQGEFAIRAIAKHALAALEEEATGLDQPRTETRATFPTIPMAPITAPYLVHLARYDEQPGGFNAAMELVTVVIHLPLSYERLFHQHGEEMFGLDSAVFTPTPTTTERDMSSHQRGGRKKKEATRLTEEVAETDAIPTTKVATSAKKRKRVTETCKVE